MLRYDVLNRGLKQLQLETSEQHCQPKVHLGVREAVVGISILKSQMSVAEYLLHPKTRSSTFREGHLILLKRFVVQPSFWLEFEGIWEDTRAALDKVRCLRNC